MGVLFTVQLLPKLLRFEEVEEEAVRLEADPVLEAVLEELLEQECELAREGPEEFDDTVDAAAAAWSAGGKPLPAGQQIWRCR